MNSEQFELLVTAVLDGSASDQERDLFRQCLAEGEEYRQIYCKQSLLHALLTQRSQGLQSLDGPTPIIPMEVLQQSQRKKAMRWMAAASVAAVVALGIFLSTIFMKPSSYEAAFVTGPETQFELMHHAETKLKGNVMAEGSVLILKQGSVQLTFSSGVEAVVEAPARLRLEEQHRLALERGKAWFHVPEQAVGFTVTTADIEVVDLGTKFAVHAKQHAGDSCHVFEGSVMVRSLLAKTGAEKLVAGQAVALNDAGGLESIVNKPELFLAALPEDVLHIHWSFDALEGLELASSSNQTSGQGVQTFLTAKGDPSLCLVEGKVGKALQLSDAGEYLRTTWAGIEGSQARSIAFWIQSPPYDGLFHSLLGWGDRELGQEKLGYYLMFTRALENGTSQIGLSTGHLEFISAKELEPAQWYHIACVYHGEESADGSPKIDFYIDGEKTHIEYFDYLDRGGKGMLDTIVYSKQASAFSIGSSLHAQPRHDFPAGVKIDEVHIFAKALQPLEVKALGEVKE